MYFTNLASEPLIDLALNLDTIPENIFLLFF